MTIELDGVAPTATGTIAVGGQLPLTFASRTDTAWIGQRLPPALPPVCVSGEVKPIVLVHGFGGSVNDFNGLRPFLVERVRAEFREAGATADEADRARLVHRVTPTDVIGHAKGGLDARTAIEHLTTVRNLVVIGTPNGGTLIADAPSG